MILEASKNRQPCHHQRRSKQNYLFYSFYCIIVELIIIPFGACFRKLEVEQATVKEIKIKSVGGGKKPNFCDKKIIGQDQSDTSGETEMIKLLIKMKDLEQNQIL